MDDALREAISEIQRDGIVKTKHLCSLPGIASEERMAKGPVAVIECLQEIPCNPCETGCPFGAIEVGEPITSLPILKEDKCKGCGLCVAACPGLAIFLVDRTYSATSSVVAIPFEYTPRPAKGDSVWATDRAGRIVCRATVVDVKMPKSFRKTAVVYIEVPKGLEDEVRGIAIR